MWVAAPHPKEAPRTQARWPNKSNDCRSSKLLKQAPRHARTAKQRNKPKTQRATPQGFRPALRSVAGRAARNRRKASKCRPVAIAAGRPVRSRWRRPWPNSTRPLCRVVLFFCALGDRLQARVRAFLSGLNGAVQEITMEMRFGVLQTGKT